MLVDGFQVLLGEAFEGSLADECPDGLAVVEDTIGLLVLLSHVEIQFDHRDYQLIDDPSDHQGQQFTPSGYYLTMVRRIVLTGRPLDLKAIHTLYEVLHLVVLESFHADEIFEHGD